MALININLNELFEGALELVYPGTGFCLICDRPIAGSVRCAKRESPIKGLCKGCLSEIIWMPPMLCSICGRPADSPVKVCSECQEQRPIFRTARAVGVYDGALRKAVHLLKYSGIKCLARPLGELVAVLTSNSFEYVDILVPVPIDNRRLKERGYNQARLIGNVVSNITGIPMYDALRKTKALPSQTLLNRAERLEVMRGTVTVSSGFHERLRGLTVLLVDDVLTTGSTANECARALIAAGARQVYVATVAVTCSYQLLERTAARHEERGARGYGQTYVL